MTINSTTRTTEPKTGNGVWTEIPFTFKVFAASDIVLVEQDTSGVEDTLTLTTDYTVTLNSNQDQNPGGTITLTSVSTTDYLYTATSDVPQTQGTNLTNQGAFLPSTLNAVFDRLMIIAQQQQVLIDRSIKIPLSDGTGLATELPSATLRAGKAAIFDESGNLTVSSADYEDSAAQAAASATAAAASAAAASSDAAAASSDAAAASSDAAAAAASAASIDISADGDNAWTGANKFFNDLLLGASGATTALDAFHLTNASRYADILMGKASFGSYSGSYIGLNAYHTGVGAWDTTDPLYDGSFIGVQQSNTDSTSLMAFGFVDQSSNAVNIPLVLSKDGVLNSTGNFALNGVDLGLVHGVFNCRVDYSTSSSVILTRHDGKYMTLYDSSVSAFRTVEIPSAGVSLDVSGSSAASKYWITAYYDGTNIVLGYTGSTPAVNSTTGLYQVGNLVVVGMFYSASAGTLDSEEMVASYFNRKLRANYAYLSSTVTTTSTSHVEADTAFRVPFLVWSGDDAVAEGKAGVTNSAGGIATYFFAGLDGVVSTVGRRVYWTHENYSSPNWQPYGGKIEGASEGYHYVATAYSTSNASYAGKLFANTQMTVYAWG